MAGVLADIDVSEEERLLLESALQMAENSSSVQPLLTEIEDVGVACDRLARQRRGLSVTDLSASEWCQQQKAFVLSARLPKAITDTPAMQAGTEQHALLEAETAQAQVEVLTETREDAFAVRLLNMEQGLRQLLQEGLTREFPICGLVQDCWVWGKIDQLEMGEDWQITVVEQKTRFQPSLPSPSQKRTTALQVMLYRRLFGELQATFSPENASLALSDLGLDPNLQLSSELQQFCASQPLPPSLLSVASELHRTAAALPVCSDAMRVNYIWQGDGKLLDQELVPFDAAALDAAVRRHLRFWRGQAPPEQVPEAERWKCSHCLFKRKCWPQTVRTVPWQH